MQHDLVFENDTLVRFAEHAYVTASLVGTTNVQEVKAWARAAFSNTSTLRAISLYVINNTASLVLVQSSDRGQTNLKMQTELNHAMLPIDTDEPDYMPSDTDWFTDVDSYWVTTFINSKVDLASGGSAVRIPMSNVLTDIYYQRLAAFNHVNPKQVDGVVPRRVSDIVLTRAIKDLKVTCPQGAKLPVVDPRVVSDITGETLITGRVPGLSRTALDMGAEYSDELLMVTLVKSITGKVDDELNAEIVTELVGLRLMGIVI